MGAQVFAFDYSDAVDACLENLDRHPKLHVAQANIYAIPFKPGKFDFVYCFGVLQHTRDAQAAFMALLPFLKSPGGQIVIDIYEKSWRTWFNPKYWLRPFTKRVPIGFLFKTVELIVPLLLPISRTIGRIPKVGNLLKKIVPVADYKRIYPLDDFQLREWGILDTFDMLSPRYDYPQTAKTIRTWFEHAGLTEVEVFKVGHLVGRGRRA
jgi:SAM-dependent methyltransferase